MPPKRKRSGDGAKGAGKKAKQSAASDSDERITLSLDLNTNQTKQGNVFQPFDIDKILQEPATQQNSGSEQISFGMKMGDEFPPNMLQSSSDDLAAHVPHLLKAKIWSNKYVNIALLLKGAGELHEMFSSGILHVDFQGHIETKPKQSKDVIPNIERWTDAFLIFSSIYSVRYPEKVQELFKYMSVIRYAASKFSSGAWREYDEQ